MCNRASVETVLKQSSVNRGDPLHKKVPPFD